MVRSGQACEVGLVVEAGGAHVGEVAHSCAGHAQESVGTHLAEAQISEGNAPQTHLVFTGPEVHHELLGARLITRSAHQPELVSASATVEVVGAGTFKDGEGVIAVATKGAVTAGADDEVIVAAIAAEAAVLLIA